MSYIGRVRPSETTSSVLRSTYTGNGSTTTYALPGPVANETSIIATINGVTQQDAAYSTDGSNIIFDAAPTSGDSIEIRTISAVAVSYAPMAGSVVTGIIADGAVTTDKIANNSITTAKIAAGAVVQEDLAAGVAGNGPAFSAFLGSSQTLSNGVTTVVQNNLKTFDTIGAYNNTSSAVTLNGLSVPAWSFMPPVAGYYMVTMATNGPGSGTGQISVNLFKIGSAYQQGNAIPNASFGANATGSFMIYLNGTTDYITMCAQQSSGASAAIYGSSSGIQYTYFSACMIRSA